MESTVRRLDRLRVIRHGAEIVIVANGVPGGTCQTSSPAAGS